MSTPAPTLCEAFQRTANVAPDSVALRTPGGTSSVTWRQYAERVERIAAGLHTLGVRRGDTVALMMTNRPEFSLIDTAVLHLGATPFSIYNTSSPEQVRYLFGNAGNKVVLCEIQFLAVIEEGGGEVLEHIVTIDGAAGGTISLDELESSPSPDFDFEASWKAVRPTDLVTLIYTSGTTGPPKGVEIDHANVMAEIEAIAEVVDITRDDRFISFLPSAHIVDRLAPHYVQMIHGTQTTCIADPRQAVQALPEVRPSMFFAVPRVWDKIRMGIQAKIAAEENAKKKRFALWSLAVGEKVGRKELDGQAVPLPLKVQHRVADKLVLSKIRTSLGLQDVKWAVSGAASIAPETLYFFAGIGIRIAEGWGMSETCGANTTSPVEQIKIGTVGKAMKGVELKVLDDGELLVRGPMVMRGYRNDPVRTAETLDLDGWIHTGDIAEIDDEGYVTIVDRKKELIINAAGKNMSPTNIENAIKSTSPLLGAVTVIGDGRPYNVALLVIDSDAGAAYAAQHLLPDDSAPALAKDGGVLAAVAAAVEAGNAKLSRVEQVKKYEIIPSFWEPGGDELTPTMKLRRKVIAEKYAPEIERLYSGADHRSEARTGIAR